MHFLNQKVIVRYLHIPSATPILLKNLILIQLHPEENVLLKNFSPYFQQAQ